MIHRKLDWKPDKPDIRDNKYGARFRILHSTSPLVDLESLCSPVVNQGDIGSCTANALTGLWEFLEIKDIRDNTQAPEVFGEAFSAGSRLFLYWHERVIEGSTGQDDGAQLRSGIKSLSDKGLCPEKQWVYEDSNLFKCPPLSCYQLAYFHKIKSYYRISGIDEMKACISEGFPFVFGFSVYDYFLTSDMDNNGILKMPGANEEVQGGHAVMACGYDDTKKLIKVRNSWGSDWGLSGYFWMPYDYITNSDLCDDFWTIRR